MYAIKEAVIAKEHLPGVAPAIFYMDIRAQGKDFDLYYERARKDYGIRFVRSQLSRIAEKPKTRNLLISYIDETRKVREEEFDLIVLSVGMRPEPKALELAFRIGVSAN